MTTAEKIVSVLLGESKFSNWLHGKWQDVKSWTGVGTDMYGLGKNTEKGWKPRYGDLPGAYRRTRPRRPSDPEPPGENVWKIS